MNKINIPEDDFELIEICKKFLNPAVIGDVLDEMGYRNQFLPSSIKPISRSYVCVGRAMPVQEVCSENKDKPFGEMFKALDSLRPGEVYISSGEDFDFAQWGGLMSNRAKSLGSAGAILGGFSRDTNEILKLNFPVFSSGTYSKDQKVRGHVDSFRVPITFKNGVIVHPGDLIFGDMDGVLIIPHDVERIALEEATNKIAKETSVRDFIVSGKSSQSAFKTYVVM